MRVSVIVNPVSGPSRRFSFPSLTARARRADRLLRELGAEPRIFFTEWAGQATQLTTSELDHGAELVVAWGGDGTVNEVARALADRLVPLAIVPSGSGNGLARALGVPRGLDGALRVAVQGVTRTIDAGLIDDRFFVNVAGLGLDAQVAHHFNANRSSRGLSNYVRVTLSELWRFQPVTVSIDADGELIDARPALVALANSPQYGNGALIAPQAKLDDARLDLVVVKAGPPLATLWRARRLYTGTMAKDAQVCSRKVRILRVRSREPIRFHVDGEPCQAGRELEAHVLPASLRVKAPKPARKGSD